MNEQDIKDLESWAEYARQLELEIAFKDLKRGQSVDEVLEKLSHRLSRKILHPLIKQIKYQQAQTYDSARSQREYKENYLDSVGPKADHVEE